MSKAFFRFLRGELNGFYLTSINDAFNVYSNDIKKFFIDFKNQQFELGKISEETLYNIGKFASVFLPRRKASSSKSSLYMTESHVVDDTEFSERGLFNTNTESFEFEHTDESITTPDINTLATETKRSSLVGDEVAQGYISQNEVDVLDDEGKVKPEKVLPEPPENTAYSEFYGNQFLFISDEETTYEDVAPSLFIELFKAIQWIRYNGTSLESFVKIISILCPEGMIKIKKILAGNKSVYIYYVYDVTSTIPNKDARLALWEYIVNLKFKQISLVED